MNKLHTTIIEVTNIIIDRSKSYRKIYLNNIITKEDDTDNDRSSLACSNMAHIVEGSLASEKKFYFKKYSISAENVAGLNLIND